MYTFSRHIKNYFLEKKSTISLIHEVQVMLDELS